MADDEPCDWQGLGVYVGSRVLWRGPSRLYAHWSIGTVDAIEKAHDRGGWSADLNRWLLTIRWCLRQKSGVLLAEPSDTVAEGIPIGNITVLPDVRVYCPVCNRPVNDGVCSDLGCAWCFAERPALTEATA